MAPPPPSSQPVLFGRARAPGGFALEFLTGPNSVSELAELPARRLNVGLQASDGRVAQASVEFGASESAKARYRKLVTLFAEDGAPYTEPDTKWTEAIVDGAGLGLWFSGNDGSPRPLNRERVALALMAGTGAERHALTISPTIHGRWLLLQTAPTDGPSLLIVVPPGATSVTLRAEKDGAADGSHLVVADFSGPSSLALSYGRFLADGASDAAHAVGSRLAKAVFEGDEDDANPWNVLAAAQWSIRTGPGKERAANLRHLLRKCRDFGDAFFLDAIIGFHYPSTGEANVTRLLRGLRETIVRSPPVFTETLSLLSDNIMPMFADVERDGKLGVDEEASLAWFRSLAQAMVWRSPFTTFRAIEPRHPQLNVSNQVLADAKKKADRLR